MANKYNRKLTPELSDKLCEAIAKGYSIPAACSVVGIVVQTYYNWYNKGKEAKSGKFRQFYCDVNNAQDTATHLVETVILDSIPTNPNDAKWWLTKRRPDIYADRTYNETKLEANVQTELLAKLERPLPELNENDK